MEGRVETVCEFKRTGNVLYIMNRDQRIHWNYSIELAYSLSTASNLFILYDSSQKTVNDRQKRFIKDGLIELEKECRKYFIPLGVTSNTEEAIKELGIGCLVLDFSPLKECLDYKKKLKTFCEANAITFFVCDSHNLVPAALLPYKRSSRAVKINLYKLYNKYLRKINELVEHPFNKSTDDDTTFKAMKLFPIKNLWENENLSESSFFGGESHGNKELEHFFTKKFKDYAKERSNPEKDVLSNLSPYLNTGQLSAQKIIYLTTKKFQSAEIFLNEIFVWKETAEHFCLNEKRYDSLDGALDWAKETLIKHSSDKRNEIYSLEKLEKAETNDPLWNAGQREMVITGKMHGYVRMYWAKTILKWCKSPEEALRNAIYLNDKYSLDGNDPSGYLGIMWSICGVMDQGWKERDILGKIRPMNAFKAPSYISKWSQ